MKCPLWIAMVLLVSFIAPSRLWAQTPRTERVTLLLTVISRDPRPIIPCGGIGEQPRDVTAHIESVDGVAFDGQIQLRWYMCEFSHVDPGMRFCVRLRRTANDPHWLAQRYRVLGWDHP